MPGSFGGGKPPVFNAAQAIEQDTAGKEKAAQQTQQFAYDAADKQYDYAKDAFGRDWSMDTIGQETPIGSLTYTTTIDPITGLPKYQANQKYSPEQQALLERLQMSQYGIGQTAGSAIGNTFDQYAGDPNLIGEANSLTQQAINSQEPAWERFMSPQRAQRRTELLNQGIMEGSPTFDLEMAKVADNQLKTKGAWLADYNPKAFDMAKQEYQLPMENVLKMLTASGPAALKGTILDTPTNQLGGPTVGSATQAAPDTMNALKAQFESEKARKEYGNQMFNTLAGLGLQGAAAFAGGPIGMAGMGALKGMFANPTGKDVGIGNWGTGTALNYG